MGQILQSFLEIHQKEEYVASIEYACQKLNEGEAEELRVEIKNITKEDTSSKIKHYKRWIPSHQGIETRWK